MFDDQSFSLSIKTEDIRGPRMESSLITDLEKSVQKELKEFTFGDSYSSDDSRNVSAWWMRLSVQRVPFRSPLSTQTARLPCSTPQPLICSANEILTSNLSRHSRTCRGSRSYLTHLALKAEISIPLTRTLRLTPWWMHTLSWIRSSKSMGRRSSCTSSSAMEPSSMAPGASSLTRTTGTTHTTSKSSMRSRVFEH